MPEQDLNIIAQKGIDNQQENIEFRQYLRRYEAKELDRQVSTLNEEVSANIDCTSCGNCCRQLMINVEDSDVERLSESLAISPDQFVASYIERSGTGDIQVMNTIPCHFLSDNKCLHYQHRLKLALQIFR